MEQLGRASEWLMEKVGEMRRVLGYVEERIVQGQRQGQNPPDRSRSGKPFGPGPAAGHEPKTSCECPPLAQLRV